MNAARQKQSVLLRLTNKVLGLIVLIRYGHISRDIQYYYRDTYYCRLVQLKYLLRDYLFIKKPYKQITFTGEFAPELQFVLPFAYWHYKNGTLDQTMSSAYTKELYFFSPHHEEITDTRVTSGNYNYEIPRILYSQDYDMQKWLQVPLKEVYSNKIYVYEKPLLVIANRYNSEWDGPPISFLSMEILAFIVEKLSAHYTIVYNRPRPQNITMDNSDIYDMQEYDWLREKYPQVLLMEDLYAENKGKANNFNHLQLMVYANADRFISVHGGTATLASYFGGINLILSKKGPEHHFKCFQKLYPKFSDATILHARSDEEVRQFVVERYIP